MSDFKRPANSAVKVAGRDARDLAMITIDGVTICDPVAEERPEGPLFTETPSTLYSLSIVLRRSNHVLRVFNPKRPLEAKWEALLESGVDMSVDTASAGRTTFFLNGVEISISNDASSVAGNNKLEKFSGKVRDAGVDLKTVAGQQEQAPVAALAGGPSEVSTAAGDAAAPAAASVFFGDGPLEICLAYLILMTLRYLSPW